MGTGIVVEMDKQEALESVYAIEAIALLMQKANERTGDSTPGMYGSACVIENHARRLRTLLGEG